MHTVAHSTRPSFRPNINNKSLKKFLSLAGSWVKVVKNGKILTFKVNFLFSIKPTHDQSHQGIKSQWYIPKVQLRRWMILVLPGTFSQCHCDCGKTNKQTIFYVKNYMNLSNFFSLKNIFLGAHFLLLIFFENSNFQTILFSKMTSNFWRLLLNWPQDLKTF